MSFANNRQLQHFTVKTDVRFLKETKKEHTELEVVALDKPVYWLKLLKFLPN